jgi:hypothetical protein
MTSMWILASLLKPQQMVIQKVNFFPHDDWNQLLRNKDFYIRLGDTSIDEIYLRMGDCPTSSVCDFEIDYCSNESNAFYESNKEISLLNWMNLRLDKWHDRKILLDERKRLNALRSNWTIIRSVSFWKAHKYTITKLI